MQRIEKIWSSTDKSNHVNVLADMAYTIWQSNYFSGCMILILHFNSTLKLQSGIKEVNQISSLCKSSS